MASQYRSQLLALASISVIATASSAQAQVPAGPSSLISVCSGVSLPRSVVTDTLTPVINGIVTPTQNTVNPILGVVGAAIPLVPPLSIDAAGLLATAAAGQSFRLQVLANDGTLVGPGAPCNAQADSVSLTDPAGLAIGGNQITGLGTPGLQASAGAPDAIAIGDRATTATGAAGAIALGAGAGVGASGTGSLALGSGAGVTSTNSVALGANSVASRGNPEVSIGAPGAERQLTNVAAGTAPTDAANVGQVTTVANGLAALGDRAVQYDDVGRARVTLGGAGGTLIGNVAPGSIAPDSTEAVNGAQLATTNQAVASNGVSITNLSNSVSNGSVGPVRYSDSNTPATPNGGTPTNDLALVGAAVGPVGLHNVSDASLTLGSTDAVNGGQLAATNAQVAGNSAAIAALGATVAGNTGSIVTLNTSVAGNTTAIANLSSQVANGSVGPVQYSSAASPTTPNGGVPSNDVTLVGVAAGPVGLHGVAAGVVAVGSTDAVNGDQLSRVAAAGANAVTYGVDANGNRTNTVMLMGGAAAAPVNVDNVAAGAVAVGSTQAINGGQLSATNTAVAAAQSTAGSALAAAGIARTTAQGALVAAGDAQNNAAAALALGQSSVQYDSNRSGVTLNSGGGAIPIHNVGVATSSTDAVNLAQLQSGLAGVTQQLQSYTDGRLAALGFDLKNVRRDADAGTATALAAAGLPQAFTPGAGMLALGGGTYGNQSAFAIGFSKAFNDGHTIVKLAGSRDTRGRSGASGGIGYQF